MLTFTRRTKKKPLIAPPLPVDPLPRWKDEIIMPKLPPAEPTRQPIFGVPEPEPEPINDDWMNELIVPPIPKSSSNPTAEVIELATYRTGRVC